MSARTKARKRALDMLYQADLLGTPLSEILGAESVRAAGEPDRLASWQYAEQIVTGIIENATAIDEQIVSTSESWALDRMPHIDRAILRVGVWEMLYNDQVPADVAIDEALELAKAYSTEDSSRFVHGVLGRIADLASL